MKELKYYGIHACLALAEKRPSDVVRAYIDSSNLKVFRAHLKRWAKERVPYHVVGPSDLEKLAGTLHHEGICVLAKEGPKLSLSALKRVTSGCLLFLDGVENPHNFGSILRTAAHFGVPFVLGEKFPLTPSACRIAKGGAEIVKPVLIERSLDALQELERKGFCLVATTAHGGESLYGFRFPEKTILMLGSEVV